MPLKMWKLRLRLRELSRPALLAVEDFVIVKEREQYSEWLDRLLRGPWVPVPIEELRHVRVRSFWRPTADGMEMPMTWIQDIGSGQWAGA